MKSISYILVPDRLKLILSIKSSTYVVQILHSGDSSCTIFVQSMIVCAVHNKSDRGTVNLYSNGLSVQAKNMASYKARDGTLIQSG